MGRPLRIPLRMSPIRPTSFLQSRFTSRRRRLCLGCEPVPFAFLLHRAEIRSISNFQLTIRSSSSADIPKCTRSGSRSRSLLHLFLPIRASPYLATPIKARQALIRRPFVHSHADSGPFTLPDWCITRHRPEARLELTAATSTTSSISSITASSSSLPPTSSSTTTSRPTTLLFLQPPFSTTIPSRSGPRLRSAID